MKTFPTIAFHLADRHEGHARVEPPQKEKHAESRDRVEIDLERKGPRRLDAIVGQAVDQEEQLEVGLLHEATRRRQPDHHHGCGTEHDPVQGIDPDETFHREFVERRASNVSVVGVGRTHDAR
jgi:hypothetical protein